MTADPAPADPGDPGDPGVGRPLAVPAFRWFFTAEVTSALGSAGSGIALAFAVLDISGSAAAVGWVAAASTVPMVTLMLLGGAVADRLPRTLVLRGTNATMFVVRSLAAVLVLSGHAEVWQLVVLQLVAGTTEALGYPAFHGMIPVLLPPQRRKAGYLLFSQAQSATRIVGPAAVGLVVATVGAGWAMAFDALTYLLAAGFLGLLRLPRGERAAARSSVLRDLADGWAFARRLGWVLPVSSYSLVFNALIAGGIGVLGPVIAADTIGSDGWGVARSGQAVGVILAAWLLGRAAAARLVHRPLVAAIAGFGVTGLPVLALGLGAGTVVLTLAFGAAGAGFALIDVAWGLVVAEKVPEEMLSRIQSIDGFFSFVGMPVGELLVGPLAVAFSTRSVELGLFALFVAATVAGLSRPALRRVELGSSPT
ncbi:MFS transporter [Nocardioides sp. GY 10127]|uniref:MFS transporter n=1 Tax=Nocardioides sp. GY 10127 TaxID=2569762 RepID=UPI0010A83FA9|nr:MFS transporter [Nocardioides sp. GY 10127]TIC82656.1 MFS transporter [Nocardioides sp. GY 10127]